MRRIEMSPLPKTRLALVASERNAWRGRARRRRQKQAAPIHQATAVYHVIAAGENHLGGGGNRSAAALPSENSSWRQTSHRARRASKRSEK